MSLEYAILGFLNYHPYTGYDLKKVFDTSIHHFWPADQSQIYRTLARLTREGLTEMEKVPQDERPDRKVYSITDAGRTELMKWLSGPPQLGDTRNGPLIQVFFAGQLTDEQILIKFEGFAAILQAILAQYDQIPDKIIPYQHEISSPREHFFWLLTLDSGIRSMRASLAWAENVIDQLQEGKVPAK
jgi:DNA-binding PadR family transcriptional regulator